MDNAELGPRIKSGDDNLEDEERPVRVERGPSSYPLPTERVPEGEAERKAPPQTPQPGETVKQPLTRAERQWRTPLRQLMKARGFD